MHQYRRKLTEQYGANWGLITKRRPHAISASQKQQMSHAHTYSYVYKGLKLQELCPLVRWYRKEKEKQHLQTPVCTSMLWKGGEGEGIQSSLLLPPSPFAGKMEGSVFRRLILFFFSMVACGQEERGNISWCLEEWMERWLRYVTCTFYVMWQASGSRQINDK